MNGKQKKKVLLAAVFVVVCGLVCVTARAGRKADTTSVFEIKKTAEEEESVNDVKEDPQTSDSEEEPEAFCCVVVHVCGAVNAEGIYTLLPDSRIGDAITAAGGFSREADVAYHNLAAKVTDGQQIYVPTGEETKGMTVEERAGDRTEPSGESAAVNLNRADKETLMTLSGIGEAKAEAILQYRKKVGPFQRIEDIKNISGIGDAMFERIKDRITVE